LAEFWTAVILRAPHSLTQALEEAAAGTGAGWPTVQATPEAFFERCPDLHWRFFAALQDACVTAVLPDAPPCYVAPLPPLRTRFAAVWVVEGSRLDAGAHRRKLLRDMRAPILPGCLTAFYDLYRGIVRHLAFNADAAAGELPHATTALATVPRGTLLVGDRLYGVGAFFAALSARGLSGVCRRNARQSWRWVRDLRQAPLAGGVLRETLVAVPATRDRPTQELR
jgi:hypothetical protein